MNIDYDLRSLAESEDINKADKLSQLLLQFDAQTESFLLRKFSGKESELQKLLENYKFDKPTFGLSQSKIKMYYEVLDGKICPKAFFSALKGERIDLLKTSPEMIKGQVFEYEATGQTNYWDEIPDLDIKYNKSGTLNKVGEYIEAQAEIWKKFIRKQKFSRINPGFKMRFENGDFLLAATPDVFCQKNKVPTYIDLKYSDPWGTFGKFAWSDSKLISNDYLLLQARQVLFIHFMNTGEKADFIFYIANKASEIDAKARSIEFLDFESEMKQLYDFFKKAYRGVDFLIQNGLFEAEPILKSCALCNLVCEKKTDVPEIKTLIID